MKRAQRLIELLVPIVRRHDRQIERALRWIMITAVAVGLPFTLWRQHDAIASFDWRVSWQLFVLSVLAFSVAPLAQAVSFWLILRFLTGTTAFTEAMRIWSRSYLVRYVPSGALELVLRIGQRRRLNATSGQVLLATGYEHLGALASGSCACIAAFAAAGGFPPALGLAVAVPALLLTLAVRPGFAGRRIHALALKRGLDVPQILRGRQLAAVVAVNAAAWIATGTAVYVLVAGLTKGGTPTIAWLTAAYSLGYLVGFITPFLPGGLGAREGTVIAILVPRYGIGVATALALAIRLANTLGELVACAILETCYLAAKHVPRGLVPQRRMPSSGTASRMLRRCFEAPTRTVGRAVGRVTRVTAPATRASLPPP